jgi:hypothetical protein
MDNIPKEIKVGKMYTTSWANNKFLKWKLIDVTNNKAYLKSASGNEIKTHVNNLRTIK